VGNGFNRENNILHGDALTGKEKLNPLPRSWRVGRSNLNEERFIIVEGLELREGGGGEI